jgi:hypothetical protein
MHEITACAKTLGLVESATPWPGHVEAFYFDHLRKAGMVIATDSGACDEDRRSNPAIKVTEKGKIFTLIFEELLKASGQRANFLQIALSGMLEPITTRNKD